MGLLDQNYQDQRLKKKVKPAIQGGGPNYLGKEEEVTVPKRWLSDPDHVVAELAYITPREKKILLDIDLYGSLNGTPNSGPGGIPSLQGDMGSVGGGSSGGGGGNSGGGGGGGRQDTESQYGGDYGYNSSQNVSTRDQQYGGGNDGQIDVGFQEALRKQAIKQADPVFGDPDPYVDVPISERDTITSFLDNYAANVKANPLMLGTVGLLTTLYQTEQAKKMLLDTPGYEFLNDYSISDDTPISGDGDSRQVINNLVSQLPYTLTGTTPQESIINQYFSNMPLNSISSNLQTDYNNAKNSINSILGITPVSQQFGYSTQPYGSTNGTNLMNNLLNIDYLRTQGLI